MFNDFFPQGGYYNAIDVYLDPNWDEGEGFEYTVSFQMVEDPFPNFHYLNFMSVRVEGGELWVGDYLVEEPEWYTFRHNFGSHDGAPEVDFELLRNGDVMTAFGLEAALSPVNDVLEVVEFYKFDIGDISNGYSWFSTITEGLQLPVDNYRVVLSGNE
jgi:hypothetical protein